MGSKKRSQQVENYDEASSGSDDDDSAVVSSQESLSDGMDDGDKNKNDTTVVNKVASSSDESSSDSDESSSSSEDERDDDDANEPKRHKNGDEESGSSASDESDDENNDDGGDDSEVDSGSDEDTPLYERIRRKEQRGLSMQKSRERKSQALELASKRLATLKDSVSNKKRKSTMVMEQEKNAGDGTETKMPKVKKNKNKHKPAEVSSKRSDFFRRGAPKLNESGIGVEIGAHRYKPSDPRVSNLSGHFNEEQFHKNYSFLDEMRNQEIGQIRKRIAAHKATGEKGRRLRRKLGIDGKDPSALEEDEARLKFLTQQRADLERRKVDLAAKKSVKRKIREDVESGKSGAYFLKRKEKKRLEMEAKLEEIKKRGGKKAVEKILAKKRRKNKSRDAGMFAK